MIVVVFVFFTAFEIFLVSEAMIFFTMFWGFMNAELVPNVWVYQSWPPLGIVPIFPFGIPLANVIILLYSTWPLQMSLIVMKRWGVHKEEVLFFIVFFIYGFSFIFLQLYEFITANFTFTDSVYGSTFYATTGLHGLHVTLGLMGFLYLSWLVYNNQLCRDAHLSLILWSYYWHVVDVVWICVFIVFYLVLFHNHHNYAHLHWSYDISIPFLSVSE